MQSKARGTVRQSSLNVVLAAVQGLTYGIGDCVGYGNRHARCSDLQKEGALRATKEVADTASSKMFLVQSRQQAQPAPCPVPLGSSQLLEKARQARGADLLLHEAQAGTADCVGEETVEQQQVTPLKERERVCL